jgi:hypothetical protein
MHDGENSFHEQRGGGGGGGGGGNYAPQKKGSYVEPGMEHLTTNIFVGNLDPNTTEEELTDAFRQFGEMMDCTALLPLRQPRCYNTCENIPLGDIGGHRV